MKNLREEARVLAKRVTNEGFEVVEAPTGNWIQMLPENVLLRALDAQVYRLYKMNPELFSTSLGLTASLLEPAQLKCYLYGIFLNFVNTYGSLEMPSGFTLPSCEGCEVPLPFAAWLATLLPYSEGGATGSIGFKLSGTPAFATGYCTVGTLSTTALDQSINSYWFYTPHATYKEVSLVGSGGSGAGTIYTVFQNPTTISNLLRTCSYRTLTYGEFGVNTEGSAYTMPYDLSTGLQPQTAYYVVNRFNKWRADAAWLYLEYGASVGPSQNICKRPIAVPQTLASARQNATYNWSLTTDYNTQTFRWFYTIMEEMEWNTKISPLSHLNYAGVPLKTLEVTQRPLRWDNVTAHIWASLSAIQDATNTTASAAQLMAWFMVHQFACLAEWSRWDNAQSCNNVDTSTVTLDTVRIVPPPNSKSYRIAANVAQLIAEHAPIVYRGHLVVPYWGGNLGSTTSLWCNKIVGGMTDTQADLPLLCGTTLAGVATFKVSSVTIDGAWNTGYQALTGVCIPWLATSDLCQYVNDFVMQGYGAKRNGVTFPPPRAKFGGLSLATFASYSNGLKSSAKLGTATVMIGIDQPITICSDVPLQGAELGAVLLFSCTFNPAVMYCCKYTFQNNAGGDSQALVRQFAAYVVENGGTFAEQLAKAFERRHLMSNEMGFVTPGDEMGVCLWDATKDIIGKIANYARPALSAAAGVGCGAVFAPSAPFCVSGADYLLGKVIDLSKVSTNRHDAKKPNEEMLVILNELNMMKKKIRDMEVNENIPPPIRGHYKYKNDRKENRPTQRKVKDNAIVLGKKKNPNKRGKNSYGKKRGGPSRK